MALLADFALGTLVAFTLLEDLDAAVGLPVGAEVVTIGLSVGADVMALGLPVGADVVAIGAEDGAEVGSVSL